MSDYTTNQAQNDIANLRGEIAHLLAYAEMLQVKIDTSLTLPDGTVWNASGITGSLKLKDESAPAAASGYATLYADTSGFTRMLPDSASNDSDTYVVGHKIFQCTSNTTVTNASPTITGMSAHLATGNYVMHATLIFQSLSTSTVTAGWNGTATISSFRSMTSYLGQGQATMQNQGTFGTLPAQSAALVSAGSPLYLLMLDGTVNVSAAGTLVAQANGGVASTGTVLTSSYMFVSRI